jgi:hypothetical protein
MSCSAYETVHVVNPKCGICGIGDGEAGEAESEEFGARITKKVADPKKPKAEDIEELEKTHLPYRSWCRHCVRGRGREMPHQTSTEQPTLSEIHYDFCSLGDENDPGNTIPVLVARERLSKMTLAAAVPS